MKMLIEVSTFFHIIPTKTAAGLVPWSQKLTITLIKCLYKNLYWNPTTKPMIAHYFDHEWVKFKEFQSTKWLYRSCLADPIEHAIYCNEYMCLQLTKCISDKISEYYKPSWIQLMVRVQSREKCHDLGILGLLKRKFANSGSVQVATLTTSDVRNLLP